MKKFFTNFKQQFSELEPIERLAYVFMCVGIFFLAVMIPYIIFDFIM